MYLVTNELASEFTNNVLSLEEEEFREVVGVERVGFDKLAHRWKNQISNIGRPFLLSPIEQVLIFFLHLRHYIPHLLIAVIMGATQRTVGNEIARTLEFFHSLLTPFVS